ncbi:MAG: ABC transporter permease [Blastocatellia bacterium]
MMLQDLRYGARMLLKQPGLTLIAVLTLALGIGLNTALFSVVNSILLRPLVYRAPERLAQVWETWLPGEVTRGAVSPNNFLDWRAQAQSFEQFSAYNLWLFTLTGTNEPTEVPGLKVSANFFDLLGVAPQLGRGFAPDEDQPDRNQVAVISHDFWQRRFGGRADVIGQPLRLDDGTHTVIGILRPDFRQSALTAEYRAEIWIPLLLDPAANRRGVHSLHVVARLKSNVGQAQAQTEMTVIGQRLAQAYPATNAERGVNLVPLHEQATGRVSRALLLLQGATALVLLIACVNVANLLLARVTAREKELAVRSALGAGRWRIARLLLAEGLTLAALGGAAGALSAYWLPDLLVAVAPKTIPRLDEITVDGRALAFAVVTALVTVLLFGLAPAWQAARVNLNTALKESGRGAGAGQGLRNALIVAEVALTLILLTGSGLLLRSLLELQRVNLGFNPDRLLTMRVSLLDSKYPERRQIADYYRQLLASVTALPGVRSAAVTSNPPLIKLHDNWISFRIEERPVEMGRMPTAKYAIISPEFFHTLAIPLRAGRAFDERDTRDATQVAILNEDFARRHFPNGDALGKRIAAGRATREVVGIVGNVRHNSPEDEEAEKLYVPHAQQAQGTMLLMARAADPQATLRAVQQAVWQGDPEAAVSSAATMDEALAEVVARPRFNALLLGLFALVALALAAVGLYGVMSYTVSQHTREIGIRLALGAEPRDVLRLVLGQGLVLTLTGIVVGAAGALGVTRLLRTLLFGVSVNDPLTFASVALLLLFVALLACWIPARRATQVDPLVALRCE